MSEPRPINRPDEFLVNLFWIVMVSWPFLGMYGLLGGMIAFLVGREEGEAPEIALDAGSY